MEAERTSNPTVADACPTKTKSGNPCRAQVKANGYCAFHDPANAGKFAQISQRAAERSAIVRRARRKVREAQLNGRDLIRETFESDPAMQADAVAVLREGLKATTKDGDPDYSERRQVLDALLAQAYGKPQQNIQQRTDVTITVVSRLDDALTKHADVELPESSITELEA